ncbi:hypothetical protein [Lutibacter sp.]|uniref:hypothetical protein n=1 Tax=Lutibacter sp. TaxID=1925666 RepID=UPI0027347CEB|nr:hypothetical protein [Lutibacter sp.]MDP3314399.1 hypothetical protein [Lutibacter sp.]
MALHKFEKDIKKKLENRTINPSANAWDKLESRLSTIETKKSNSFYWFIGIAASIVGILLVVPIFINNKIEMETPIIVTTKTDKNEGIKKTNEENFKPKKVSNTAIASEISTKKSNSNNTKKEQFASIKATDIHNQNSEKDNLSMLIEIAVNQERLNQLSFEEQKIAEMLTEIKNLKTKKHTVSAAEIETLLIKAQKEIALSKIYIDNTKMVDANLLLQDVEVDLDKSFRVKFLEALKINYDTMITAVSQRND